MVPKTIFTPNRICRTYLAPIRTHNDRTLAPSQPVISPNNDNNRLTLISFSFQFITVLCTYLKPPMQPANTTWTPRDPSSPHPRSSSSSSSTLPPSADLGHKLLLVARVALDDCYGKTLSSPPLIRHGDKPTPPNQGSLRVLYNNHLHLYSNPILGKAEKREGEGGGGFILFFPLCCNMIVCIRVYYNITTLLPPRAGLI